MRRAAVVLAALITRAMSSSGIAACILASFLVALSPPAVAAAQRQASTLAELAALPDMKPGKALFITFARSEGGEPQQFLAELIAVDQSGVRVKLGTEFQATPTDLRFEPVGRGDSPVFAELPHTIVEIPARRVVRISGIDSLRNGAAIGAGLGAVPGLLGALAVCSYDGGDCGGPALAAVGISAAVGAGLGILFDAARRREGTTLYAAPGSARNATYEVVPIVSRVRKGATFVIRW